jgi:hypothetical protein
LLRSLHCRVRRFGLGDFPWSSPSSGDPATGAFSSSLAVLDVQQERRDPARRGLSGLQRPRGDTLSVPRQQGQPILGLQQDHQTSQTRKQRQMLGHQRSQEQTTDGTVRRRLRKTTMVVRKLRRQQIVIT